MDNDAVDRGEDLSVVEPHRPPALSEDQVRTLLNAPPENTLKGRRDRTILSLLLFHDLRRYELGAIRVADVQMWHGILHLQVEGKGSKIRYLPVHPHSAQRISDHLSMAWHGSSPGVPLFLPLRGTKPGKGLSGHGVSYDVVGRYARQLGLDGSR